MKACYITRHNTALLIIQRAILRGNMGGFFTVMDATAADSLPCGVAFTRIPKAFLPSLSDDARLKFRPDIMIVEKLPSSGRNVPGSLSSTWTPSIKAYLKSTCIIHILEFGYCSDKSHTACIARKQVQHQQLISALESEGWLVTYHTAVITSSGQVFNNVSDSAASFGVPDSDIRALLHKLHVHTVKSAFYIVKLRRRLENNPAHFHALAPEDHPRPP